MSPIRPHASLDDVTRSLVVLSGLVALLGAALIVGPGFNNPQRFGPYVVAFAMVAFFVPGLLGVVAGVYLKRRAAWAWSLGVTSAVMQAMIAIAGFAGQFFLTPISPVPLLACAAWALAAGFVAVELIRYRHAVRSDVVATRGFDVEAR